MTAKRSLGTKFEGWRLRPGILRSKPGLAYDVRCNVYGEPQQDSAGPMNLYSCNCNQHFARSMCTPNTMSEGNLIPGHWRYLRKTSRLGRMEPCSLRGHNFNLPLELRQVISHISLCFPICPYESVQNHLFPHISLNNLLSKRTRQTLLEKMTGNPHHPTH